MMCDGAGWHDERALTVPDNVTLALLPPYRELRERFHLLSFASLSWRTPVLMVWTAPTTGIAMANCDVIE